MGGAFQRTEARGGSWGDRVRIRAGLGRGVRVGSGWGGMRPADRLHQVWPTRRHAARTHCQRSREADTRPHRGPAVGKRVGDRGSRALGARLHQRQRHHRRAEVWHDCARCTACTIEPQQHPLLIDSLAASLLPTRYQASCCASCSGFAARLTGRSCTSLRGRAASHSFAGIYCSYPRSRTAADG